jgi:hypothetical protein
MRDDAREMPDDPRAESPADVETRDEMEAREPGTVREPIARREDVEAGEEMPRHDVMAREDMKATEEPMRPGETMAHQEEVEREDETEREDEMAREDETEREDETARQGETAHEEPMAHEPAMARGDVAATPTGAEASEPAGMWPDMTDLRQRFDALQSEFIDDPKAAVTKAEGLINEVVERITRAMHERMDTMHHGLEGNTDTEQLRLTMRGYRDLVDWIDTHRAA